STLSLHDALPISGGGRPARAPRAGMNAVDPWPPVPAGSPFGMANLPFGVFSQPEPAARGGFRRIGVAVGDHVLDLAPLFEDDCFAAPTLDPFLARGRRVWSETRARITELLT